jgi:hypothetical protein
VEGGMTLLNASEFVFADRRYPPRELSGTEIRQIRELKPPKVAREKWYADMGRKFMCPAHTVRDIIRGVIYRAPRG